MTRTRSLFIYVAMICVPSSMAHAEDFTALVQKHEAAQTLVNEAPKTIPYSYLVTYDLKSQEGDDVEEYYGQYRMNPLAVPGQRITFIEGTLDDLPDDMREEVERLNMEASPEELAEDFWCESDKEMRDALKTDSVTLVSEDENEAVLSLGPDIISKIMSDNDGEDERKMPKKIRKRMLAEVTLSKPELHLKHSRIWLSRPTTVKVVAKMKEMNFEQSCSLAPNGFPYMSENTTRIAGKALGSKFNADVKITISDLQPTR